MTWWDVFVGLFFVIAVAVFWTREHLRAGSIRKVAQRLGLRYLGKSKTSRGAEPLRNAVQ